MALSRTFISCLPTVLLIALYQCVAFAQPAQVAARVDSLFAEWNKSGLPGAAVGIVHGGKLIYAKGFGEADLETAVPIKPETIFHVASVSKQFTAYAVVLLAQQGKLSLDDNIRTYLPEVPDFGKTITIRQLIHHTSGLRDQWRLVTLAGGQMDDVITTEHLLNLVKRQRELNFTPGTEFMYCNTGYMLLAEIIARVTKQPFREWMQERIFRPLGMSNTQFYDNHEHIVKGRAYSFHKAPIGQPNGYNKSVLSFATTGATGLFTTINDLAKWITNFHSPIVGNTMTITRMLERGRLINGDTLTYAFALEHGTYKSLPYYGHGGGDAGFRSYLCYFPGQDYGFIVLSNQAEFNPESKAFELADLYMGALVKEAIPTKTVSSPRIHPINPALFDRYTGSYEAMKTPGFIVIYERQGNHYYERIEGQPRVEIFPSSDTTFFFKSINAQLIFHRPASGLVTHMTAIENGSHPCKRIMPYVASQMEKQQLVGKYYSPELETIYSITLQNDSLKLAHIHHGEVTLNPLTENRFRTPWFFMRTLDVVRTSSGQVIGFQTSNDRVRNLWFSRLPVELDKRR